MKRVLSDICCAVIFLLALSLASCSSDSNASKESRCDFGNIIDISYTPDSLHRARGWFTDAGSWMGFTIPQREKWINGFCGPFSLDSRRREWLAKSATVISFKDAVDETFVSDTSIYYPGEAYLSARDKKGRIISQRLNFIDENIALLRIQAPKGESLVISGSGWSKEMTFRKFNNKVVALHPSGEIVALSFNPKDSALINLDENGYKAVLESVEQESFVTISFYVSSEEYMNKIDNTDKLLQNPLVALEKNTARWNGYLSNILRNDLAYEYDRIAVKALTTLISNWRVARGALYHEGFVPSHAVGYFVGFWAWDSWRFSACAAKFAPELAKNNIRAMFDYQLPDGMVIDCIFTNPRGNNSRDSKPPLACWAVDEIFKATSDTTFLAEIYPKLLSYYKWWYAKRDHDGNGMCEYGSTDGTLEAAAWESGMDNAIRFDNTIMVKNKGYEDAWSMNQESVDLNAYLAMEAKLLKKFATVLGLSFDAPDYSDKVAEYFFCDDEGFFFDRKLDSGEFICEPGCEAYTPLWTKVADKEKVAAMLPLLSDTAKFSTYIPFPTVAADNPKYNPRGYWRGPIWLDQTYFAIRGLRNYGYSELADSYTMQVFDRLQGLKEGAPIHENYGTHTGERLKAPHFSWSSVHLLMLYWDYGKSFN